MFKAITINGKEYHLEYTIEASLYEDATQKVMDFMLGASTAADDNDENAVEAVKASLRTMSNVPSVAMTLFYAGLLEHHGPFGDKTVKSITDAKSIIRDYMAEHEEDGTGTWYDILNICLEQMSEDGFFKRIGLDKIMAPTEAVKPNRAARRATAKKSPSET